MYRVFKLAETDSIYDNNKKSDTSILIDIDEFDENQENIISKTFNIQKKFLDVMGERKASRRIEKDVDNETCMTSFHIPVLNESSQQNIYYVTETTGMIIAPEAIITIGRVGNKALKPFMDQMSNQNSYESKTQLLLELFRFVSILFLDDLHEIEEKKILIEKKSRKNLQNKELYSLMQLEKSLIYFTGALKTNKTIVLNLLDNNVFKVVEKDKDLLDDVLIDYEQSLEHAARLKEIIGRMTESYGALISNETNDVMKFLTVLTIILTVPTMVFSFYGMNVNLPFINHPSAWIIVLVFSIIISIFFAFYLWKRKMW